MINVILLLFRCNDYKLWNFQEAFQKKDMNDRELTLVDAPPIFGVLTVLTVRS